MTERKRRAIAFYAMISPWLIIFLLLSVFPLGYGLYLSFTNYFGFNISNLSFVGLRNYKMVFSDPDSIKSMGRTVFLTLFNAPLGMAISFLLALILHQITRGVGIFRTIFYLPAILPVITTVLMWRFMFTTNNGILNTFIGYFGISKINWLGYDYAMLSLLIYLLWGVGAGLLINIAGLKAIPSDLYEAASIDGASPFQRLKSITLPLMTPVLFFCLLTNFINTLQVYLQPIQLTSDPKAGLLTRPIEPIYLYAVHAFQQTFAYQRFSYGLALLWVMVIFTLILSIIIFTTSKYWVHYDNDMEGDKK